MPGAADDESRPDELDDGRLDEPPLVVSCLGPGIREEGAHADQAVRGNHALEHDDRIGFHETYVADTGIRESGERLTETRSVDVDGEHSDVRLVGCYGDGGAAVAEADLDDKRHI